jgi:predicted O-linked N-acetylglucosamine transferase (SPINDLY family)
MALEALGRPAAALESYAHALALRPDFGPILYAHARVSHSLGRLQEALATLERFIALGSRSAQELEEAARLFIKLGHAEAALALLDQLIVNDPASADTHNVRGGALRALRRLSEAEQSFAAALRLNPGHVAAHSNRALSLYEQGRSAEAILELERALALDSQHRHSLCNRGMILHSTDRHEEAVRDFAHLVAIAPEFECAAGDLARARLACCDWASHEEDAQRALEQNERGVVAMDALTGLMVTGSPALQLEITRRFAQRRFPAHPAPLWQGERYTHARIRIGYLSGDFHEHPVAQLLAGVLEAHDRSQFELFGLSLRQESLEDPMHRRLRRAFEHFYDLADIDDRSAAVRLRGLEIDILIDLGGFTRGSRLGILASRCAPVQVHYLGFTGTLGSSYVDYLIADATAIPRGDERYYRECIARLPYSYLPHDDRQTVSNELPERRACGLPDSGLVLCAFNNPYKITPAVFKTWMQLLRARSDAVLWLQSSSPGLIGRLARAAAEHGVAPQRLVFAPRLASLPEHLARYRVADLFLDTTPYGAHATAHDALWAGLPVLTLAGEAFASRVGASLLSALGLPELVACDIEDYHLRAAQLLEDPSRLAKLRERLVRARQDPPFNTGLYCRHLESAFRAMAERARRGDPPATLDVPLQARYPDARTQRSHESASEHE